MRALGTTAIIFAITLLGTRAHAGLSDPKVGEVRVTYATKGTMLRSEPKSLTRQVATLNRGAQVRILEVTKTWIRVETLKTPKQEGWIRASEAVEPSALRPNPQPSAQLRRGSGRVDQRDVSAAGRQFGPATEAGYRQRRPNLRHAYAMVDRMEAETPRMDPGDSISFIEGGYLGQKGQNYQRPALLPPPSPQAVRQQGRQQARQGRRAPRVGGMLGGLVDKFGPKGKVGDVLKQGAKELPNLTQQLNKKFTPAQEYFLGRAVAAQAIAKYGVDPDETRRAYVRQVGDAVVRLSRRLPSNMGGYHFEVLNSDEVNGLSGPGGFVFVTRGMVNACTTEDELAAVLAHELAHITRQHGEKTLRAGKVWQAKMGGLARMAGAALDDGTIAGRLVDVFDGAVEEMARTAMENSYGRGAEFEADLEGTYILTDVVYDHHAVRNMLQRIETIPGAYGRGATHAPASLRRAQLDPLVARYGKFPRGEQVLARRQQRFTERSGAR